MTSRNIIQAQGEAAADSLIGIAKDVQAGYTTSERGRELAEIVTGHLSDDAKAAATQEVNRRLR
ncbi:MAG: hypothetical protein HOY79_04800 [Streptomyces sp.]|nr:hypothetical protein [Streptomyces sp.]NUS15403.1 hypothetical protein [Streptomyces sp.]NUS24016.1 hypothetical protein [Streptomyces sp.]